MDIYPFFVSVFAQYKDTDRVLAEYGEERYTYREMWSDMHAVARFVSRRGDQSPVAVWGDKENRVLPCLFGAILGGHPYVFIPSYYPQTRVEDILGDCGAKLVLSASSVPFPKIEGVTVTEGEAFTALLADCDGAPAEASAALREEEAWAIFYTSGSTGKPKGVAVTGANIRVRYRCYSPDYDRYYAHCDVKPLRVLNITSYAFSFSLGILFYSLAFCAATCCSMPITTLRNFPLFFETLLRINPDGFSVTPSMIELMMKDERFCERNMPAVKYITAGGEVFNPLTARRLMERFPHVDIYNGWGSTETAASPLIVLVGDEKVLSLNETLPIGTDGSDLYSCTVTDADGNALPDGEVGEMVIAGDFVTAGYLNMPEKTAEKFFVNADGKRAYRTGDLIFKKDGYIFFKGRLDNMVKVGGYRIEPEDVENNLRAVDIVASCAVAPVYSGDSVLMLAAYVVLKPDAQSMSKIAAIKQIKAALSARVQEYMLPQKISIVDELPKNTSGKLDRVKLKEMSRLQ